MPAMGAEKSPLVGIKYVPENPSEGSADALELLEQSKLPRSTSYIRTNDGDVIYRAIGNLDVRGAPNIAHAASYAVLFKLRQLAGERSPGELKDFVRALCDEA